MSQHSADWELFEQHCSAVASELNNLRDGNPALVVKRSRSSLLEVPMAKTAEQRRRRTMSTISPGSKSSARWTKKVDCTSDSRRSRLVFTDYLIKPVQRICKYPLLLERLKPVRPTFGSDEINTAVENAIQVMRNVAASVDEARHKQEALVKTSLIISRLVLPPPSSPLSPPSSPLDSNSPVGQVLPLHALTPSFLSSLGPCLLAGSLDVMCYSPRCSFGHLPSITAKYLGAFLYSGGYLILTKVHKGKKYEPRHWFSLADFEVAGVESDEGLISICVLHFPALIAFLQQCCHVHSAYLPEISTLSWRLLAREKRVSGCRPSKTRRNTSLLGGMCPFLATRQPGGGTGLWNHGPMLPQFRQPRTPNR